MKVSVIIPVYNHKRLIERCLDSIIEQSYSDLEIVVVNDGSTDGTCNILSQYKQKDPRIKIIYQKNSGTYKARKLGIENSSGKAIFNMDSDDFLEENAISLLVRKMKESGAEIVVGDYYLVKKGIKETIRNQIPKPNDKIDALRLMLTGKLSVHLWGRLYKKTLLEKVDLPVERPYTEDVLTNIQVLSGNSIRFAKVDIPLYNYIIHDSNTSYSLKTKAVEGFFREFVLAENMLNETTKRSLESELALYRSKDWIVYCRKKGELSQDRNYHRKFFKRNYAKAKSFLAWYLKVEMILFRWVPGLGKLWFPMLKKLRWSILKFNVVRLVL